MLIAVVLAILTSQDPTPGWQYARWGMTPSEVAAASSGRVVVVEDSSPAGRRGQTLAEGTAEAGPFSLNAKFGFHNGRLSGVYLTAAGQADCGNLANALDDLYGPEDRTSVRDDSFRSWRLPELNTAVAYYSEGATCSLRYTAIRHSGNVGL